MNQKLSLQEIADWQLNSEQSEVSYSKIGLQHLINTKLSVF
jgi:hypothetical protein